MASANKTENFGLNQWVGTDPILREDFNADNLVIEQALAERCFVKLGATTLTAAQSGVTLDLSAYDLSRYHYLKLLVNPVFLAPNCSAILRLNGISTGYTVCAANSSSDTAAYDSICSIPGSSDGVWAFSELTIHLTQGALMVDCVSMSANASEFSAGHSCGVLRPTELAPEDLSYLYFMSASGPLYPGTTFVIYACE